MDQEASLKLFNSSGRAIRPLCIKYA
ncbi:hypothetical protein CCACVL1_24511 [Corchorus capsularis]|uniref:Uncharacterized protein n=1 Tax=Corchorus capsularis TaxID=210143 RepID=A0A1R3GPH2_COCAP|nr:hypothetical protein CCACVL1_24511 [Corchorus capsularis]